MIRLTLEFNGFDTHLALKGIRWDDKKYFFEALEESVRSLIDEDDSNEQKQAIVHELSLNHQCLENFKLKLGHKNFIINLCHELQSISSEEFNGAVVQAVVQVPEMKRDFQGLVVRRQPEEHGYSRENEKRQKEESITLLHEVPVSEEPVDGDQFEYETVDDEESPAIEEQSYLELDDELEVEDGEEIEYHELKREGSTSEEIYVTEQIIMNEADQYEQARYEISGYESSSSHHRSGPKSKKPKHMYTSEFLQSQSTPGRIGTPGRRRPKLQKSYPDTEAGLLDRWADLIRQSCEVIVPQELLQHHDLSHVEILKLHENVWEVKCPLCTKKLRVQMTHEGKYTNYKRSNFERHLRIVHYNQIKQYKPNGDPMSGDEEPYAESH